MMKLCCVSITASPSSSPSFFFYFFFFFLFSFTFFFSSSKMLAQLGDVDKMQEFSDFVTRRQVM